MPKRRKVNGKKIVSSLRALATKNKVRLADAFLLADLHPSNISRWYRGIHAPRLSNIEEVETAIELLGKI